MEFIFITAVKKSAKKFGLKLLTCNFKKNTVVLTDHSGKGIPDKEYGKMLTTVFFGTTDKDIIAKCLSGMKGKKRTSAEKTKLSRGMNIKRCYHHKIASDDLKGSKNIGKK